MSFALIASAALVATAAAQGIGSAHVVNKCTYPVTLCNVPAADGGFTEIDKTLQPNDSYEQEWTQLTNGNGWSIKLSKDTSLAQIMQYEYTFHNDGTIWYDLSDVDGNPWDGDWMITADQSTCTPKQQAYRFSTDDAYGMQACPQDSSITVTLCSGEEQADGEASSVSASVASVSSTATETSYSTPDATPTVTYADSTTTSDEAQLTQYTAVASSAAESTPVSTTLSPTTFATSTTAVVTSAGAVVTQVDTAVVTEVVTQTYWQHQHQWGGRHAHQARHPHARA